jgi:hypothetical protein
LRGGVGFYPAVQVLPADLKDHFTPNGIGAQIGALRLVDRDFVARNADDRDLPRRVQQGWREHPGGDCGQLAASKSQVGQGNKRVRLAPSEGRLQPVQGRRAVITREAAEDIGEDHAQALGRIRGVAKELLGVGIEGMGCGWATAIVVDYLAQADGKDLRVK